MTTSDTLNSNYDLMKLSCFFRNIPYLQLAKPNSFEIYVKQMARKVSDLEVILNQYPHTLYQPLDDVYTLMRYVTTLDEPLIDDLLEHFGWRGAVVSSWLIILNPNSCYLPLLQEIEGEYPINDWIVKLAIDTILNLEETSQDDELCTNLLTIKQAIKDKLPSPIPLIKSQYTFLDDQKQIRHYHKQFGTDKTIEYIKRLKQTQGNP